MRSGSVELGRGRNNPVKRKMDVPTDDDVVTRGKKEELKRAIDGMDTGVRTRKRMEKGPGVPSDWGWQMDEAPPEDEETVEDDGGFIFRKKTS